MVESWAFIVWTGLLEVLRSQKAVNPASSHEAKIELWKWFQLTS